MEESESLENTVREFFRSIFFVLESKRLDLSFEKLDPAPCPILPDEQKYRIGVENKGSKLYRFVFSWHYFLIKTLYFLLDFLKV